MIEPASIDRQAILAEIDRVINEMVRLRARVASSDSAVAFTSTRDWEIFGMWADREDMSGMSTTDWLDRLRREQWGPRDDRLA